MNRPRDDRPDDASEETLFDGARACASAEERAAYLDRVCAGNPSLRHRVECLLHSDQRAQEFLAANPLQWPVNPSAATEQPGDRIGPYKLLEKIGEGGCGVVYMADQEAPVRRRVALKIIKLGLETKSVIARFEAERQALALMDHPNIAKFFDAGTTGTSVAANWRSPQISAPPSAADSAPPASSTLMKSAADASPPLREGAPGRPYFVMELVRGLRITDYCDQKNLSTRQRLDLFIEVCHAVQHAHQKGIIHRDLKPSNILVTESDGKPVPKVIDFGIAKATEGRLTDKTLFTQFAALIGTPAYMSPEQAELTSRDIDTRSDIYSLGVLLYELLTGTTPFDTKELLKAGIDELRRVIREVEPPTPSTRLATRQAKAPTRVAQPSRLRVPGASSPRGATGGETPPEPAGGTPDATPPLNSQPKLLSTDLDWIVMKCLEKDRARRYETANGLAADLQRHLDHEPVLAHAPSAAYRFQKWVRRNKLIFAATSAVLAALVLGLSASLWQFSEKSKAYRRALDAEQAQSSLRQQAETEAATSEQTARFLIEMLRGVRPDVAKGRDTTVLREILDRASEKLDSDLREKPEVQARLRITIAGTYFALGDWDKAEVMHRTALAARKSLFGNDHPQVTESCDKLAEVLEQRGQLAELEALRREELSWARGRQHGKPLDLALSLMKLANALRLRGNWTESEALYREALASRQRVLGPEHADVAETLNDLSFVLRDRGDIDAAEAMMRQSLAMYIKTSGSEVGAVAMSLNNLAMLLVDERGEWREAEAMLRQAVSIQKKTWASRTSR